MVAYNLNIPDGPNNPSADQPKMKTNTNAVHEILEVDHVTFNTPNGGTHKKITYIDKHTAASVSDPSALSYTNDGVANPTHPQQYYKNSQGVFPISAVRAFGTFTAGINPTMIQYYNVDAAVVGAGTIVTPWVITLSSSTVVNSEDVVILATVSDSSRSTGYTFTNPTLSINLSNNAIGKKVNFVILQI